MHRSGESRVLTAGGGRGLEQGHAARDRAAENFSIDGPDCRS
jgi:hypothetical protein